MRIYRLKIIEVESGDRFDYKVGDYQTVRVNNINDLPKEIALAESGKPKNKGMRKLVQDIELLGIIG